VDEVFDEGDSLVVRNKGQEERISLSDISCVNYMSPWVTLTLSKPSIFGAEIAFRPKTGFATFLKSREMKDLIKKIEAQRAG
jgi:hypothetical protein